MIDGYLSRKNGDVEKSTDNCKIVRRLLLTQIKLENIGFGEFMMLDANVTFICYKAYFWKYGEKKDMSKEIL